jgi:hypothetical protein
VHLLEAQDISVDPPQLRLHQGLALSERRLLAWLVVEIFDVEGGKA